MNFWDTEAVLDTTSPTMRVTLHIFYELATLVVVIFDCNLFGLNKSVLLLPYYRIKIKVAIDPVDFILTNQFVIERKEETS